jgi:threonine dehydrogenase-like Zn-dependent dehydrogenase
LVEAVRVGVCGSDVHSGLRPQQSVAILGAGTIGLMTLAPARRAGPGRIVVTDMVERKRAAALDLGADAAVDATHPDLVAAVRAELGESADVVFDCVAIQPTMNAAIGMALKNGTVVIVVGVPWPT